jgi:hypothetical protein
MPSTSKSMLDEEPGVLSSCTLLCLGTGEESGENTRFREEGLLQFKSHDILCVLPNNALEIGRPCSWGEDWPGGLSISRTYKDNLSSLLFHYHSLSFVKSCGNRGDKSLDSRTSTNLGLLEVVTEGPPSRDRHSHVPIDNITRAKHSCFPSSMAAVSMASEEQRPLSSNPQDSPGMASHTPLPAGDDFDPTTLHEPQAPFLSAGTESPRNSSLRNSYAQPGTPTESGMLLANKESMGSEEEELGPTRAVAKPTRPRRLLILIGLLILVVLLIAIIVPIYFTVIKPKTNAATGGATTGAAAPTSSTTPNTPPRQGAFSGGDGSTIRATNGTTFTYNNKLGGICEFVVTTF